MIIDRMENLYLYAGLSAGLAKAFEILKDGKLTKKTDGRYDIDSDLYYIVQHYITKPMAEGKLEAHRKYIDVQFVAEGRKVIGYAPVGQLEISQAYDEQKDIAFYKVPEKTGAVVLSEGMFCVLFPHDAHMPGRQLNGPADVHKIFVKVKTHA